MRWYRRVYDRLRELGFDAPIMRELDAPRAIWQSASEDVGAITSSETARRASDALPAVRRATAA